MGRPQSVSKIVIQYNILNIISINVYYTYSYTILYCDSVIVVQLCTTNLLRKNSFVTDHETRVLRAV